MKSNFNNTISDSRFYGDFHPVVLPFGKDDLCRLDISTDNNDFTLANFSSTESLTEYIDTCFKKSGATFLIGGYGEHRNMYLRSELFESNIENEINLKQEPRSLHLGIDIWGSAGTPVHAPLGGMVHSFQDNAHFGDYGPTVILQHQVEMFNFYTLYGHMSRTDLARLRIGQFVTRGEIVGHFGEAEVNGNWPPHLHFQIIEDISTWSGDYPGVCKPSESDYWLANSPDPKYILQMDPYHLEVV